MKPTSEILCEAAGEIAGGDVISCVFAVVTVIHGAEEWPDKCRLCRLGASLETASTTGNIVALLAAAAESEANGD